MTENKRNKNWGGKRKNQSGRPPKQLYQCICGVRCSLATLRREHATCARRRDPDSESMLPVIWLDIRNLEEV